MIAFEFLLVELLSVDGSPGIDDIGQHEGHEQRYVEHGAQRELTRTGIGEGERRLEIGRRGVVGCIVPGTTEQQGEYGEYGADACRPDASDVGLGKDGLANAEEHEHDSY